MNLDWREAIDAGKVAALLFGLLAAVLLFVGFYEMTARILPVCIFILSAGAGVSYTFAGDWRRAMYWYAAAALTFAVTV